VQEGDKPADADDGTQQQNKYCFNHDCSLIPCAASIALAKASISASLLGSLYICQRLALWWVGVEWCIWWMPFIKVFWWFFIQITISINPRHRLLAFQLCNGLALFVGFVLVNC
jgi:hypothetical protein